MSLSLCALCAILLVAGVTSEEVQLPRTVKTCNRETGDYSSCLRLAIQESWPTFVKGIPNLVQALDPVVVDKSTTTFNYGEDIHGTVIVKDVKSYGLANTKFLAVRPLHTKDRFHLQIDVEVPKIFLEGDYKAHGDIGIFKIGGKGNFNISMENIRTTWDMEGPVIDDRWVLEHFRQYPEIGSMKVYASDLFNGNEELNKAAMSFINEYWQPLYQAMLPFVAREWDLFFTDFVNPIFAKLPFSKLFP